MIDCRDLRHPGAPVTGAVLWLVLWAFCGPARVVIVQASGHGRTSRRSELQASSEQMGEPDHDR